MRRGPTRYFLGVAIGLASFLIYAALAIFLQPQFARGSGGEEYAAERMLIAGAISTIRYGAPVGTYYEGIDTLLENTDSLEPQIKKAASGGIELGRLVPQLEDGSAFGFAVFVTLAMRIFGLHLSSLGLMFVVVLATTTTLYLLRFGKAYCGLFIPLFFFTLTLMLTTPLVTNGSIANQVPVGGYRYYSLIGIIPAMHVIFELLSSVRPGPRIAAIALFLAGCQIILLAHLGLATNSANYLPMLIGAAFVIIMILRRGETRFCAIALQKAIMLGAAGVLSLAVIYVATPEAYKQSGHIADGVWSRAFTSLGESPEWPFGNLREVYSGCKEYIPDGLRPGNIDQNGHCVWIVYAQKHNMPYWQIHDELYDSRYESVLRDALFDVFTKYPSETIKTFLYYKPLHVATSINQLFQFYLARQGGLWVAAIAFQFILLIGFIPLVIDRLRRSDTFALAGVAMLGIISCFPLYLVAWGTVWTVSELLFYLLALCGVVTLAAVESIRHRVLAILWRTKDAEVPA